MAEENIYGNEIFIKMIGSERDPSDANDGDYEHLDQEICEAEDKTEKAEEKPKDVPEKRPRPVWPLYGLHTAGAALWIAVLIVIFFKFSEVSSQVKNLQSAVLDVNVSSQLDKLELDLSKKENDSSSKLKKIESDLNKKENDLSSKLKKIESDLNKMDAEMVKFRKTELALLSNTYNWFDFGRHKYYFSTERRSWTAARDACVFMFSYLAVINSVDEKNFINNKITEDVWVGLSDLEKEGVWKWISGESVDKSFWGSGEPNNQNEEDCGEIKKGGMLNDIHCTAERRWVCEKNSASSR
ncbi:C-type lectin domain family 10 member A-like [Polypterus senegalus]|uniref:C-type lectin domain family 10 member A-like n=1 Tax=Polypterus senegalus TaxID=55291 RepID=UPI0019658A31|nr:C-type lectin domain family 10 member A-like [Polypterus senegalus]